MNIKKIFTLGICASCFAASVFAYNPPVQGENIFGFANPYQLTYGNSVAGGALFNVTPATTVYNPALGSMEKRFGLDFGYTGIFGGEKYDSGFEAGFLAPTKYCNITTEVFGLFANSATMQIGNAMHIKTSVSKEITDKFSLGIGLGAGVNWGYGTDWSVAADIGALYNFGTLGFMENFRIGAAVLNLGKTFNALDTRGVDGSSARTDWFGYPGFATFKIGAAAEFVNQKNFVLGLSLDVTSPCFMNLIVDSGVQMRIANMVTVTSSWQYNMKEHFAGCHSWFPTVGVIVKLGGVNTSFTGNKDWSTSDISIGGAYKNINNYYHAGSIGASVKLGQADKEGPQIEVGEFEVEEDD